MPLVLLIVALLVAGCSPPVQISNEAALVRSKCSACHPRPEPGGDSSVGWAKVRGWHQEKLGLDQEKGDQVRDHLNGLIPPRPPEISQ